MGYLCIIIVHTSIIAEWSSLVARRAHNPKVVGSNPASATKNKSITFVVLLFFIMEFDFEPTTKGFRGNKYDRVLWTIKEVFVGAAVDKCATPQVSALSGTARGQANIVCAIIGSNPALSNQKILIHHLVSEDFSCYRVWVCIYALWVMRSTSVARWATQILRLIS